MKIIYLIILTVIKSCDTTETLDSFGDSCLNYHSNEHWCGLYDDEDFDSNTMCCACQSSDDQNHDDQSISDSECNVTSCIGEFLTEGQNTYGVYYMSNGNCISNQLQMQQDTFNIFDAESVDCNQENVACGTLEKSDARFRGCFPTDPTIDTYYQDQNCNQAWTTSSSTCTNDGNTVDRRKCQEGNNFDDITVYLLQNGNCISEYDQQGYQTNWGDWYPASNPTPTQCEEGSQYCLTMKSDDGEQQWYQCSYSYQPKTLQFYTDSDCKNAVRQELCFGDYCNDPESEDPESDGSLVNGELGLLAFYGCFIFLPIVSISGIYGIVYQCCCKKSSIKNKSSSEKKKKRKKEKKQKSSE